MKFFLGLFLLLIIFPFFSCQKQAERKLEGDWREINVINPDTTERIDWNMSGGYLYIIQSFTDNAKIDTQAYGEYTVKVRPLRKIFSVTSCSNSNYLGDWKITKLTNKNFSIAKEKKGVTYHEFSKQ